VKDGGPVSLLRDLVMEKKYLAYDLYRVMEGAKDDEIFRIGGRLEDDADVELTIHVRLYILRSGIVCQTRNWRRTGEALS
jgi:hypothetical protein